MENIKSLDLKKDIAKMIVRRCKLHDVDLENVDYDIPLFYNEEVESVGGFELDSVDALELVAGVKAEFGITIESGDMAIFYSISSLAKYIEAKTEVE